MTPGRSFRPARRRVWLLALLALGACATTQSTVLAALPADCRPCPPEKALLSPVRFELIHQGCFGRCPMYRLKVHDDGTLEYLGLDAVRVAAYCTGHVSPAELQELDRRFDLVRLHGAEDDVGSSDLPIALLVDRRGGQVATRRWNDAMPDYAASALDGIALVQRWVRGPPATPGEAPRPPPPSTTRCRQDDLWSASWRAPPKEAP